MRILIAFVCMGFIGAAATVLAVVQLLVRAWPMLILVLGIVVAVRLRDRRRRARRGAASWPALPASTIEAARPPIQVGQPIPPRAAGWVLVPVWMETPGHQPQRHPVIDGEVITGGGHHG